MPQLSPALGFLIFVGVLSFFILLIIALKNKSKPVSPLKATSKKPKITPVVKAVKEKQYPLEMEPVMHLLQKPEK